ncbi:hypothetical protein NMG60_11001230 [Bertholletia excelsa]
MEQAKSQDVSQSTLYYQGIRHAIQTVCKDEGIFGLYKGLGSTLLGVGPNIAISFSIYETLRSYWHSRRPDDSAAVASLACGSLSGIASSTVNSSSTISPLRYDSKDESRC